MNEIVRELKKVLKGDVATDEPTRGAYQHDASIYEMLPSAVLYPKSVADIKRIVDFTTKHKSAYPTLSITPRGAGTDMSGAAITNSLLLDMTRHFDKLGGVDDKGVLHVKPATFVREIDPYLAQHNLMLGCAPASRAWCTIGGMVANNSGGEQSLRFGNADRSVRELSVVLADGNEYTFAPLTKSQLSVKMKQKDFEGEIYRKVYQLIEDNYDLIHNARPKVNKNSMGYNLWAVWDRETGIFDMTQLFAGSQATLGVITDIKMQTYPKATHTGLLIAYVSRTALLDKIIPLVASHHPSTFEGFDDITFNLGVKYFKSFRKQLGAKEYLKQQANLLGSVAKFKGHLPNLVLMVEFEGNSPQEVLKKILALQEDLKTHKVPVKVEIEGTEAGSAPFWTIRRASLALLRQRVKGKYASAFMDDLTVDPRHVAQFFPEVRRIIRKYKLPATIAGHFGDGNFHIIPLMDISNPHDQLELEPAMRELIPLVLKYKGTMAGEHNDGMVRGPWLPAVFGEEMYEIFKQTKEIFDPLFIFNPHKKTDASWDFSMDHIRTSDRRNLYK